MQKTGLDIQCSDNTKEKAREKIAGMIKLYKTWRLKADTAAWGTDPTDHKESMYGGIVTIKSIILDKCFFFLTLGRDYETQPYRCLASLPLI